jgi:hypothetical protein
MKTYRIRAYRRQLVEVIVTHKDDEWAWDEASDLPKSKWDVIETLDVEDAFSITEIPQEDEMWEQA